MAKKHYTALGEQIDMSAIATRHSNTVALGNARMNARGDIVGNGGVVLRTQEQIEAEWRKRAEQRQLGAGISPDIKAPLPGAARAAPSVVEDPEFDPEPLVTNDMGQKPVAPMVPPTIPTPPRRRKIVDAD